MKKSIMLGICYISIGIVSGNIAASDNHSSEDYDDTENVATPPPTRAKSAAPKVQRQVLISAKSDEPNPSTASSASLYAAKGSPSQSAPDIGHSSGITRHSPRINTLKDLTDLKKSKKESPRDTTIAPTVVAHVAHVITFKKDADKNSKIHAILEEKLTKMEHEDPATYKKIEQLIFLMNNTHDGDLTAAGHQQYKSRKIQDIKTSKGQLPSLQSRYLNGNTGKLDHSDETLASSSEVPQSRSPLSRSSVFSGPPSQQIITKALEEQATPRSSAEIEYDWETLASRLEDLEDVKQQLKKLTSDASDDAQAKSNRIAKWSIIIGGAATVGIGLISALVTYYSAIAAAHISAGGSCPQYACANGSLIQLP